MSELTGSCFINYTLPGCVHHKGNFLAMLSFSLAAYLINTFARLQHINIVTNHLTRPQAKYALAYTFSMHFTLLFYLSLWVQPVSESGTEMFYPVYIFGLSISGTASGFRSLFPQRWVFFLYVKLLTEPTIHKPGQKVCFFRLLHHRRPSVVIILDRSASAAQLRASSGKTPG